MEKLAHCFRSLLEEAVMIRALDRGIDDKGWALRIQSQQIVQEEIKTSREEPCLPQIEIRKNLTKLEHQKLVS